MSEDGLSKLDRARCEFRRVIRAAAGPNFILGGDRTIGAVVDAIVDATIDEAAARIERDARATTSNGPPLPPREGKPAGWKEAWAADALRNADRRPAKPAGPSGCDGDIGEAMRLADRAAYASTDAPKTGGPDDAATRRAYRDLVRGGPGKPAEPAYCPQRRGPCPTPGECIPKNWCFAPRDEPAEPIYPGARWAEPADDDATKLDLRPDRQAGGDRWCGFDPSDPC